MPPDYNDYELGIEDYKDLEEYEDEHRFDYDIAVDLELSERS